MDFAKDWSSADTIPAVAALGATYADMQSTKDMLHRGGIEHNPLLGSHPSDSKVDSTFALETALAGTAIAALPPEYRRMALGAVTGLEGALALQNQGISKMSSKTSDGETFGKPALAALAGAALAHLTTNFGVVPTGDSSHPGAALTFSKRF